MNKYVVSLKEKRMKRGQHGFSFRRIKNEKKEKEDIICSLLVESLVTLLNTIIFILKCSKFTRQNVYKIKL